MSPQWSWPLAVIMAPQCDSPSGGCLRSLTELLFCLAAGGPPEGVRRVACPPGLQEALDCGSSAGRCWAVLGGSARHHGVLAGELSLTPQEGSQPWEAVWLPVGRSADILLNTRKPWVNFAFHV